MGVFTSLTLPEGCGELPGSPKETLGDKGWEAIVEMLVPWSMRAAVLEDVVGNNRLYPHLMGLSCAYAISGSSQPYEGEVPQSSGAGASDAAQYTAAHLTIKYGRSHTNQNHSGEGTGRELYTEQLDFTDEHLKLKGKQYQWGHDTGSTYMDDELSPVIIVRGFEYTQVRYNQLVIPTSIMSLLGTSNAAPYVCPLLGVTLPAESMLFAPPTLQRKVLSSGLNLWTITYKLSGKPTGWNKAWNPNGGIEIDGFKTGGWEYFYQAGAGVSASVSTNPVKNYPPADWSSIFVVP